MEYFFSKPLAPIFLVPRASQDKENPIFESLNELLLNIDQHEVDEIKESQKFKFHNRDLNEKEAEKSAREWWLIQELNTRIPKIRLNTLKNQSNFERPSPYDHEALIDLSLSPDYLVEMQSFDIENNALIRNGFAYSLTLPREQTNSQSWIFKSLQQFDQENIYLRPDPIMFDKRDSFVIPEYKMWIYGKSFNWKEISNTKEEIHGKWRPDSMSTTTEFTEYVWSPRKDEIHFICEEVPSEKNINLRGSRYFHAIYSKKSNKIIHLDGAIRIFNQSEWKERKDIHVRKSDKIGTRVKVFLIDKNISIEQMINVCMSYFVWNEDLQKYFA